MTEANSANVQASGESPLDRVRAMVMADPALQLELSQPYDQQVFAERLLARAGERGIALDPKTLGAALRPDPLAVSRWTEQATAERWPEGDWLPTRLTALSQPFIDWAHFAGAPLADSFFGGDMRIAQARPFNWLFRYRTSVDRFIADAARRETTTPRGLVFHMSRCGSTLVSQMLAALPRTISISEAPAIDEALQLQSSPDARDRYEGLLPALASALGRPRGGEPCDLFIKLDSWHALALPHFRRAFPATPWVFLYRDPLEVMVSQKRQIGIQGVPGMLPAHLVGIDSEGVGQDEYCARVLSRICDAAADGLGAGGGLLVNYDQLPDALWTRILPHFGVSCGEAELAAMAAVSLRDAKARHTTFQPDSAAKRREATPELVELVDRCMSASYRRLEALRAGQTAGARQVPGAL